MSSNGNGFTSISENSASQGGCDPELLGFAERFLQVAGAALETHAQGLDAVLPKDLQILLNAPEFIRIRGNSAAGAADDGCYEIGYGVPLMDKMIQSAFAKIPILFCRAEFDYIKSGGFERLLNQQFQFYGAVATIETIAEVMVDYFHISFRYKAMSDEQKEGILQMVFNSDTQWFVPDMAEKINSALGRMIFENPPEDHQSKMFARLGEKIHPQMQGLLVQQLRAFQDSMNRRFRRDVNNLTEYYASLEKEMVHHLKTSTLSDSARKDRQAKIDELPSELSRKTEDLFKKYSIKVSLDPAAAIMIRTPAKKIICKLSVGRKTRQVSFIYNPLSRAIEPPACALCDKTIDHIHFNANLEMICFECRGR